MRKLVRYRKFRGHSGKVYRIQMTAEEIEARHQYWTVVAVTPLVTILLLAMAAGMI